MLVSQRPWSMAKKSFRLDPCSIYKHLVIVVVSAIIGIAIGFICDRAFCRVVSIGRHRSPRQRLALIQPPWQHIRLFSVSTCDRQVLFARTMRIFLSGVMRCDACNVLATMEDTRGLACGRISLWGSFDTVKTGYLGTHIGRLSFLGIAVRLDRFRVSLTLLESRSVCCEVPGPHI